MVDFEHRSGAYMKYVSTGAQKDAICRPSSRVSRRALNPLGLCDVSDKNSNRAGSNLRIRLWLPVMVVQTNRLTLQSNLVELIAFPSGSGS